MTDDRPPCGFRVTANGKGRRPILAGEIGACDELAEYRVGEASARQPIVSILVCADHVEAAKLAYSDDEAEVTPLQTL